MTAQATTVMLLAAGRGKRMRELTEDRPKPLLKVGGQALIEHQLRRLANAGFRNIVVNLDWHGEQIRSQLGDGSHWGLTIRYSEEYASGALETAGGIVQALPLLDSDPFLVVNADIWTDIDFASLLTPLQGEARIVLVANPPHNPMGDFVWNSGTQRVEDDGPTRLTFSGVGLYRRAVFADLNSGPLPLAPLLREMISRQTLEAVVHDGQWQDIGTPERLEQINRQFQADITS